MSKRKIVVPNHDYSPTQEEMEEVIVPPEGMTFEKAVAAMLAPTEIHEVSAKEWRKRRKRAAR